MVVEERLAKAVEHEPPLAPRVPHVAAPNDPKLRLDMRGTRCPTHPRSFHPLASVSRISTLIDRGGVCTRPPMAPSILRANVSACFFQLPRVRVGSGALSSPSRSRSNSSISNRACERATGHAQAQSLIQRRHCGATTNASFHAHTQTHAHAPNHTRTHTHLRRVQVGVHQQALELLDVHVARPRPRQLVPARDRLQIIEDLDERARTHVNVHVHTHTHTCTPHTPVSITHTHTHTQNTTQYSHVHVHVQAHALTRAQPPHVREICVRAWDAFNHSAPCAAHPHKAEAVVQLP